MSERLTKKKALLRILANINARHGTEYGSLGYAVTTMEELISRIRGICSEALSAKERERIP